MEIGGVGECKTVVLGSAKQLEKKKGLEPGVFCRASAVDRHASTVDGQSGTSVGPSEFSYVEESPGTMVTKGRSCRSVEVLKTMTYIDHG
jgi:hypothetical protein